MAVPSKRKPRYPASGASTLREGHAVERVLGAPPRGSTSGRTPPLWLRRGFNETRDWPETHGQAIASARAELRPIAASAQQAAGSGADKISGNQIPLRSSYRYNSAFRC